jgi:hypothetical protein
LVWEDKLVVEEYFNTSWFRLYTPENPQHLELSVRTADISQTHNDFEKRLKERDVLSHLMSHNLEHLLTGIPYHLVSTAHKNSKPQSPCPSQFC